MKKNSRIHNAYPRIYRVILLVIFMLSLGGTAPVYADGVTDLIIEKTHTDLFARGSTDQTYTITVTNNGTAATTGDVVTVVDTLPAGLTATAISGTGWACTLGTLTCIRSDVVGIGGSYSPITVTVNVDQYIADSVTNTVTVSGGGELSPEMLNNSAEDITQVAKPDLIITGYELVDTTPSHNPLLITPAAHQPFAIKITVKNQGTEGSGGVFYPSVFVDKNPMNSGLYEITSPEGCLKNLATGENDFGDFYPPNFLPSLPANTSDSGIVEITTGLEAGVHNIWLYVDPSCLVTGEASETNNAYGPFQVAIATGGVARLRSTGAQDGWLLESAETSGSSNSMNTDLKWLYVGDDTLNRQYVSVVSFNTTGIPDNAVITSVFLKFKYAGVIGTSPFNTHGNLLVDVRKGSFTNNVNLQLNDFKSTASKKNILSYNASKVGNWYTRSLGPTFYRFINKTGYTQFRLHFTLDDNNDFGLDLLKIYSGNAPTARRPLLIVNYYIP